jgi:pimeloyl-ACP methyl ester carboxylesterase
LLLFLVILIVLAAVAFLALAGHAYQASGTQRDLARHPAPGKLVDLGSHRLHLLSAGEGAPAVIFESGLMSTILTWKDIQPEIAKSTLTICYDRAGLGWSDLGPAPRDAGRIVDELHNLLERAAIPAPYILVGHSFGGLTTRLFAGRYAEEVAGLVLIDPVVPQEWDPASEHNQKRIRTGSRILRRASALSRWGALRFVSWMLRSGVKPLAEPLVRLMSRGAPKGDGTSKSPLFWNLPPGEREMAPVFWVQPKFTATIASQLEQLPVSAAQVSNARPDLEDKPLVVISAADTPQARREEHAAIAALSSAGEHITADHSGHWVMVDQPGLVRDAIFRVLELARRQRSVGARA